MIIELLDWDLTYAEFVEWVSKNNIFVEAVTGYGTGAGFASTIYKFHDQQDFIAFKLKFLKVRGPRMIIR